MNDSGKEMSVILLEDNPQTMLINYFKNQCNLSNDQITLLTDILNNIPDDLLNNEHTQLTNNELENLSHECTQYIFSNLKEKNIFLNEDTKKDTTQLFVQ